METRGFHTRIRRYFLFTLCLLFFVLLPEWRAEAADYDIEQYHVDIRVSESNVYYIQENITVMFHAPRHGIYRDIPMQNHVRRTDGSESMVRASVRNISCGSDDFHVSRKNGNCQIKIGDKEETISGEKSYSISYEYSMGEDVLQGADEFYYNIIGTSWDTGIKNVSFSVLMPKEFDENKLGMSYGYEGYTKTEGLRYSVIGNRIDGMLNRSIMLQMGEGLTIRLELPEGYFVANQEVPWEAFGAILLGVMTIAASYILWSNYGKDDPVVETVQFYAPEGMNSVEAAYAYKGYLPDQDVVSLVVYLAQQGYIEIRESSGGKWGSSFTLIKRKEYAGTKESERLFMAGLFRKGDYVTKPELENKFYKTVNAIVSQITRQFEKKIYFSDSLNKNWILYLMSVLVFVAAGFRPLYQYDYDFITAIAALLFSTLWATFAFRILFGRGKLWKKIPAFLVITITFGARCIVPLLLAFSNANSVYGIAFLFAIAVSGTVSFFIKYMPKRTPYGNRLLGQLGGFKRFLETAEKDRLEAMAAENPQYFYDILPFAYVLEVSDVWMKKFASIAVEPPDWYQGYPGGRFHMVQFHHFMDSTMKTATASMTSQPKSGRGRGGGGFSGGGFSGGGSGGGGGGSW